MMPDRIGTVSYTHLDVYKRQSVVIFTIAPVMITTAMVSTLTAPSVVTAQQHVKETHICSPFKQ